MVHVGVIHESVSFGNAWVKALRTVMNTGTGIIFGGKIKDKDQYEEKLAFDSDLTIVLEKHALQEALNGVVHPKYPIRNNLLTEYVKEWERGYDWKKQGFSYCYEDRCEKYLSSRFVDGVLSEITTDQWKLAKEDLENQIETEIQSNRNVIVIGNPSIDRNEIPDSPPCLREIWIRYEGKNKVSVKWLFRSRDLYGAWMSNIVGILSAVQREVTKPLDCNIVQAVDKNHSIHIYRYDWDSAKNVGLLLTNPQII